MKLKALKAHYHNGQYLGIDSVYECDANVGKSRVKNGLCECLDKPEPKEKREQKPRRKKAEK
jgi:hypothetical protein